MAGLKAPVSGIEEGGGEWRRLMGGNRCGCFSLPVETSGRPWRRREAGRRRRRAWLQCRRKRMTGGRLGRDGGLGRLGGRGPVGRGGKIDRLEERKKRNGPRLGRKAGWVES
jgi:hypothetical protein